MHHPRSRRYQQGKNSFRLNLMLGFEICIQILKNRHYFCKTKIFHCENWHFSFELNSLICHCYTYVREILFDLSWVCFICVEFNGGELRLDYFSLFNVGKVQLSWVGFGVIGFNWVMYVRLIWCWVEFANWPTDWTHKSQT